MPRLCLLTVHAHPDDESSKGAGTVARYHAQGVHTVLVCCTGGEAGDVLNPAMDRPEVRDHLAEVRLGELERAASIIGYDELVMLGYRDSGMPDTPANEDPRSFARAPLDEAIGRLVAIIRRTRPQVIVTYPDEQNQYPHPDHLRVHEISLPAFDAAGDPDAYPEAGPPWEPLKLYYTTWSRQRIVAMHEKFLELGLESPYDEGWFKRPVARRGHDQDRRQRVHGSAGRGPPRPCDPGRPDIQVLVRPACGGLPDGVALRGVRAGPQPGRGEPARGRRLRWHF